MILDNMRFLRAHASASGYSYDWQRLLLEYRRLVSAADTVLEIGASNTQRTQELASYCRELIGVELFPERLPKDNGNVRYIVADWQSLTSAVSPESIDLAISSHVIEHVHDDDRAIAELYRVLKPGGKAIFNTPNRKRLVRAFIETLTRPRRFPWWEHVREYDFYDLRRLLEASPFEKFAVAPIAIGLLGGRYNMYSTAVPSFATRWANFWQVTLYKAN